jgi:hypothetical protein
MKQRVLWLACAPIVACAVMLAGPVLQAGSEKINYADINKIKAEGLQHSQVMELNSYLSDVYAPRLTGSPTARKAADWVVKTLTGWGLTKVAIEPWANRNGFDRGWTNDKFDLEVTAPEHFPVPGSPMAWTPGTGGPVSGEAVLVTAGTDEELQKFKGLLKGKWVMLVDPPDVPAFWDARAKRYTQDQLDAIELQPAPPALEFGVTPPGQRGGGPAAPPAAQGPRPGGPQPDRNFPTRRNDFLKAEGALGTLTTVPIGHGLYQISGNRSADPATTLPAISIAAEHYNRIARMLAKNIPVTIAADIRNTFYPNPEVFNVVGEIPGTDKAAEVVLLGGHIDTWHSATGAADDGVGVAAMMEAVRILEATGVPLRRTVRVGFWEGEEQGLIGSREYVAAHYGFRQPLPNPPQGAQPAAGGPPPGVRGGPQGPLVKKPDYDKFSVYFNIDNGTGALRGIYLQGNDAAGPIFREWMEPFRSLGMTTVTIRNTGGTDHQSFDAVGLPGFQFIQDEIEYNGVTHHSNMDTYERLQPGDVKKMATIVAGFAYLAANRDEILPRKPLPATPAGGGRQ